MDRSAQSCDRSGECEIMNLRRMKFVFDVAPLEIIDDKELYKEFEVFPGGAAAVAAAVAAAAADAAGAAAVDADAVAAVEMMNKIHLVIHTVNHGFISQYWSLKSNQQQQQQQLQLNSSSSSCRYQQHHHHLRDDDDDEEMMMITCRPSALPKTGDPIILLDRGGEFDDDDYIMSQLRDLDLLYEIKWILEHEQLEEVKRCIVQRISEAKPALVLLEKTTRKAVRIRLDLSNISKRYYANPAAAASAHAQDQLHNLAIHYPITKPPSRTSLTTPLRSSKEALETKILEEEDLISSSSSCSVCLNEFRVGVDVIKKMPCSHMFHSTCLMNWLRERNTCPLCYYELPTFLSRFLSR